MSSSVPVGVVVRPTLVATPRGPVAIFDIPLACCGMESARMAVGADSTVDDPVAVVVCISGTVTTRSAAFVAEQVAAIRAGFPDQVPVYRVAVGACASSGGPYWDAPSVLSGTSPAGIDADLLVPGCPPSPQAIASAVLQVVGS